MKPCVMLTRREVENPRIGTRRKVKEGTPRVAMSEVRPGAYLLTWRWMMIYKINITQKLCLTCIYWLSP